MRVIPRSRKNGIDGVRDGRVVIRIAAPPIEDAANQALVDFLAEALGVPRRAVRIVAGERSRNKRVSISGLTAASVRAKLGG